MPVPTEGSGTDTTKIAIAWSTLSDLATGGDSLTITSYELEWYDTANTIWAPLQGAVGSESTLTTFEHNSGITAGADYQYRVRAYNQYGPGPYSDTVTIKADHIPDQVTGVATSIENTNVKIAWNLPTENHATVVSY